jgi:fluoride exporter
VSPLWWVAVASAGAAGAVCRFLVDRAVSGLVPGTFPWGTFVVNVSGSFLFGLVAGVVGDVVGEGVGMVLAVGFCGAYTTFSTYVLQSVRLAQGGHVAGVVLNVAASLAAGMAAAGTGFALGS